MRSALDCTHHVCCVPSEVESDNNTADVVIAATSIGFISQLLCSSLGVLQTRRISNVQLIMIQDLECPSNLAEWHHIGSFMSNSMQVKRQHNLGNVMHGNTRRLHAVQAIIKRLRTHRPACCIISQNVSSQLTHHQMPDHDLC